jgi:hypothetical protein
VPSLECFRVFELSQITSVDRQNARLKDNAVGVVLRHFQDVSNGFQEMLPWTIPRLKSQREDQKCILSRYPATSAFKRTW